ncbi:MAG: hypothetical protein OEZ06_32970 [Myxococcales bacterium]|nr:hypothetical protein [Myxococcales bacterium]
MAWRSLIFATTVVVGCTPRQNPTEDVRGVSGDECGPRPDVDFAPAQWVSNNPRPTVGDATEICKRFDSQELERFEQTYKLPSVDAGIISVNGGEVTLNATYAKKFEDLGLEGYALLKGFEAQCMRVLTGTYPCLYYPPDADPWVKYIAQATAIAESLQATKRALERSAEDKNDVRVAMEQALDKAPSLEVPDAVEKLSSSSTN